MKPMELGVEMRPESAHTLLRPLPSRLIRGSGNGNPRKNPRRAVENDTTSTGNRRIRDSADGVRRTRYRYRRKRSTRDKELGGCDARE